MSIDQQFVEFVVKALVSNPDAVKVERSIDEKGVLLELTVDPSDLGRVIGKRGNTAQSIRTLLRALGTKNDARYNLKIVDNGEERPAKDSREESSDEAETAVEAAEDSKADQPAGANTWAHLSSNRDDSDQDQDQDSDEDDGNDEDDEEEKEESSSVVEKTKKELEDLANLDI